MALSHQTKMKSRLASCLGRQGSSNTSREGSHLKRLTEGFRTLISNTFPLTLPQLSLEKSAHRMLPPPGAHMRDLASALVEMTEMGAQIA